MAEFTDLHGVDPQKEKIEYPEASAEHPGVILREEPRVSVERLAKSAADARTKTWQK